MPVGQLREPGTQVGQRSGLRPSGHVFGAAGRRSDGAHGERRRRLWFRVRAEGRSRGGDGRSEVAVRRVVSGSRCSGARRGRERCRCEPVPMRAVPMRAVPMRPVPMCLMSRRPTPMRPAPRAVAPLGVAPRGAGPAGPRPYARALPQLVRLGPVGPHPRTPGPPSCYRVRRPRLHCPRLHCPRLRRPRPSCRQQRESSARPRPLTALAGRAQCPEPGQRARP